MANSRNLIQFFFIDLQLYRTIYKNEFVELVLRKYCTCNTHTKCIFLSVQYSRIMDYKTTILNAMPYTSSTADKIFNITLQCELDVTIFVQILEVFL